MSTETRFAPKLLSTSEYLRALFRSEDNVAILARNRMNAQTVQRITTAVTIGYDFFDQCPQRMTCARGGFYRPKNSAAALFLEGKKNLLRLQQDIPLTEAEANAVVDGVNAFEKLLAQLSDVPTPEGPTPQQLQSGLVQIQSTNEGSR